MNPDPRHLWLAFGATEAQPLEKHEFGWRVGPIVLTPMALACWKAAGWVEQTPEPSYLYLAPAGKSAVQEAWGQ